MQFFRIAAVVGIGVSLVACSRPAPPPEPIQPQPIYNKYGEVVGCEGGVYRAGAPNPCVPYDEGCDSTSNNPDCYPQDGRDPDDGSSTGRDSNGQTATRA